MNAEIEELARLLPPPGQPALPPLRHRQLLDHLSREIDADLARSPRRLRLPGLPMPARATVALSVALSVALAAVLVVAFVASRPRGPRIEEVSFTAPSVIQVPAATSKGVAETLERIADAAARRVAPAVGPGQYVYTRSAVSSSRPTAQRTFGGPVEGIPMHQRQTWLPGDPGATGIVREDGGDMTLHSSVDSASYRRIAALPADPRAVLEWLYTRQGDRSPSRAFDQVGMLLDPETIVPQGVRAALYRATALIPGVQLVPHARDALGRRGVGVAFTLNGERTEWIFDSATLSRLGTRDYLVTGSGRGGAGTVMSTDVVLDQRVVDDAGDAG
ncbi:CU044_5270 family protein [Microbispora sp. RL4-1S]|uniref:CU044_5270 family protein n=1 Tax=Microbispora oryzae TaxID=2806554 RepID=A0A941AI59_9ACTN|nr:CU044_5270 family protein [Microbispora oryzae]MBP2702823.1 CU044_5270 family protein [Microbispora oryzae]